MIKLRVTSVMKINHGFRRKPDVGTWVPPHEGKGRCLTPGFVNFHFFVMAFDYSLCRFDPAYKTCPSLDIF